jgi:hypothetical protein
MKTILQILKLAGGWHHGLNLKIENPPYMALVIESTDESGPCGLPAISVCHYGEQNGDLMRDPEMLFEMELRGGLYVFTPYYWRNDYVGIEQYSRRRDDEGNLIVLARLQQCLQDFADLWDNNLRSQGFLEAFRRSRQPQ